MKKYLLCCAILFCFTYAFAQKGWRENEMEVKVFINGNENAKKLYGLHLTGDVNLADHFALMYVTPGELEKIISSKLDYEILKNDLNEYYKNFWNSRTEQYHTYAEIISLMDSLATAYPSFCKKIILGASDAGNEISYLKISDNVNEDETEAEVELDGGIHGDEVGGAENLIRFARYICNSYNSNTAIADLINNREIFIYPMVNPDGRINMSRYNGNGIDCNRDFGYMWNGEGFSTAPYSQTETKFMRDLMYNNQFTIHVTYHSGIEEVIFPWCYRDDHAADYNFFFDQATTYAASSDYSVLPVLQSYVDYPTNGEMIDASYGSNGALSLTMEISTDKQTPDITGYYQKNIEPMIAMIKNSGYGVEGIITDCLSGNPVAAAVFINNFFPVYADTLMGDYHKFVLPGTYTIKVVANNYETKIISGVNVSAVNSTMQNIKLVPSAGRFIYKVATVVIPDNNFADEANTPAVIGEPDNINYSLGKNGWIVLDMLQPVNNISGNDFTIYEGDATPEGYSCFASQSMDGPWTSLGSGNGTQDFDLASLSEARFIKLVDDGDGVANASDAGFDLDAIEVLGQPANIFSFDEKDNFSFTVFPNPASGNIIIENKNSKPGHYMLSLKNIQGKELLSEHIEFTKTHQLDLTNFENGIYFLTLQNEKGIESEKIIVQR